MKILLLIIITTVTLSPQSAKDVVGQIRKANLEETVRKFCSDVFEGRLSGSPGYNKAAEFAAGEFEKARLKKFNGSYYQDLRVEYNEIYSPVKLNLVDKGKIEKEYIPGKDFVCRGFTGSGSLTNEIIFCGYGMDTELFNDFSGVDVSGKIIMIFKPNPTWNIAGNQWGSNYPRAKSNTAARHGAAGIILVYLPNLEDPQPPVASVLHGDGSQEPDIPQVHVELDVADELLLNSGYTLSQLQSIIDSTKKPFSIPVNASVEISIDTKYDSSAETMNVWGLLEGSDPVLKNEYVIVGAHLDHVGRQGNVIFPGANDNASGCAAVLEMAKIFKKNNLSPRRSIIFVLFASEEQGLFGASHMAENLPVKYEQVTAMINLDCIAFGDSIQAGNGLSSPELWKLIKSIDSVGDNYMVADTWRGGGADAGSFHEKGIPAIYFASTNSYKYIHTIYDTPESLNFPLMEKITRLAFLTVYHIAAGKYEREKVIP